jgi:septin 7
MADYATATPDSAEARALSPISTHQTGGLQSSSSTNQQRPLSTNGNGYYQDEEYPVGNGQSPAAVMGSYSAVGALSIKSGGMNGSGSHGAGLGGAAEMVRKKMGSFVGFANLPNQVHRKSVR